MCPVFHFHFCAISPFKSQSDHMLLPHLALASAAYPKFGVQYQERSFMLARRGTILSFLGLPCCRARRLLPPLNSRRRCHVGKCQTPLGTLLPPPPRSNTSTRATWLRPHSPASRLSHAVLILIPTNTVPLARKKRIRAWRRRGLLLLLANLPPPPTRPQPGHH